MRALTAAELLAVWERGQGRPPLDRALLLVAAASPGRSAEAAASLSIGERDAELLTLREWMFGKTMESMVTCSRCGERLEMAFNVSDMRAEVPDGGSDEPAMSVSGYELQFRIPNSTDVGAVCGLSEPELQRRALFERCLISIRRNGQPATADQLTSDVMDAVAARMAELDPQADLRLNLTCPTCQHRWQAAFDIVSFLWSEIESWAWRILREVHILASAYGWSERDILSLSAGRRKWYLEMVGA